jgi:hypothetical protein
VDWYGAPVTTKKILSALQADETFIAQAKVLVGHWGTGDFLANKNLPARGLCLTDHRLLFFALDPWWRRFTGKVLTAIPLSEIATIESQVGRVFWGGLYCRLTLTLRDASTYQFQATPARPAILLRDALSALIKPKK